MEFLSFAPFAFVAEHSNAKTGGNITPPSIPVWTPLARAAVIPPVPNDADLRLRKADESWSRDEDVGTIAAVYSTFSKINSKICIMHLWIIPNSGCSFILVLSNKWVLYQK